MKVKADSQGTSLQIAIPLPPECAPTNLSPERVICIRLRINMRSLNTRSTMYALAGFPFLYQTLRTFMR